MPIPILVWTNRAPKSHRSPPHLAHGALRCALPEPLARLAVATGLNGLQPGW